MKEHFAKLRGDKLNHKLYRNIYLQTCLLLCSRKIVIHLVAIQNEVKDIYVCLLTFYYFI